MTRVAQEKSACTSRAVIGHARWQTGQTDAGRVAPVVQVVRGKYVRRLFGDPSGQHRACKTCTVSATERWFPKCGCTFRPRVQQA